MTKVSDNPLQDRLFEPSVKSFPIGRRLTAREQDLLIQIFRLILLAMRKAPLSETVLEDIRNSLLKPAFKAKQDKAI